MSNLAIKGKWKDGKLIFEEKIPFSEGSAYGMKRRDGSYGNFYE